MAPRGLREPSDWAASSTIWMPVPWIIFRNAGTTRAVSSSPRLANHHGTGSVMVKKWLIPDEWGGAAAAAHAALSQPGYAILRGPASVTDRVYGCGIVAATQSVDGDSIAAPPHFA